MQAIAFYILAIATLLSGLMVVASRNPVHSVLFLILSFFSAAGLFVLLGAEFLAMLLVVVYVGAVAVLFLFVVMMLDIDFAKLKIGFARYLPIGALVGGVNALYTDYAYFFEAAGLVLLVAMIGAIVLTLRHKPHVKRQDIGKQVARTPATGTHNVSIKPGSGIDL